MMLDRKQNRATDDDERAEEENETDLGEVTADIRGVEELQLDVEKGESSDPPNVEREEEEEEEEPSAESDSGVAQESAHLPVAEDANQRQDVAPPGNVDGATVLARKKARTLAAEKRRAEVEARKLERENVSEIFFF